MYLKQDFTVTAKQLAEAHGIHTSTVSVYAKEGAFPYARREGERTTLYFHTDALTLTGGKIKSNRERGLYKDPIHILEPLPGTVKKVDVDVPPNMGQLLGTIISMLGDLDRKCKRIETKIHALAEGRPINGKYHQEGSTPTVGDMIDRNRAEAQRG